MKINVKKPNVNANFDNAIKKGNLLYKLNLSAQMKMKGIYNIN